MTILRDKSKSAGLAQSFYNAYGQTTTAPVSEKRKPRKPNTVGESCSSFDRKFRELTGESLYKSFTALDLLCYFQKIARESGTDYIVANYAQEAGMFKNLMKKLPNLDICLMIEFLFKSGQTYLVDPSPRVLVSKWLNTIRRDSLLWAEDKYNPNQPLAERGGKQKILREWSKKQEENVTIGEWD